ncbi:hypothetical protein Athai_17660 [Actinocatenispora thailandica]|uniref:Uncharacterized protein n=1 Tax=Actinocatenispora thailandica TaxID=227318 RepID=A0A7R7HVW7_9ACTN|nr:hypothetical protein [Actinocatenispora thailandica]BCJ34263.1 hypothetical protein Athai_17660 [Actinocatenispora thailandica]
MLLLLLLNRVSPRIRAGLGAVFVVAGVALAAVSEIVAAGLLIHAVTLAAVGAVLAVSGAVGRRRAARLSAKPSGAPRGGTEPGVTGSATRASGSAAPAGPAPVATMTTMRGGRR